MNSEMERVTRPRGQARKTYNTLSHWYDLFTRGEKRITDIGIRMLDVKPSESALEIGCGTGHALVEFARTGADVYAVDISEGMIKAARKRMKNKVQGGCVKMCQADGLSIPFPDRQFDAIFLSFTLELFDTPEIPHVLAECRRLLKADGRIGVVSLAKQKTTVVRIYEWFHRKMSALVDCRPIHARQAIDQAGYDIQDHEIAVMWGLPVDVLVARKRSPGGVSNQS